MEPLALSTLGISFAGSAVVLCYPQDAEIHLADVVGVGFEMVSSIANPVLGLNSDRMEETSPAAACSFPLENLELQRKAFVGDKEFSR